MKNHIKFLFSVACIFLFFPLISPTYADENEIEAPRTPLFEVNMLEEVPKLEDQKPIPKLEDYTKLEDQEKQPKLEDIAKLGSDVD